MALAAARVSRDTLYSRAIPYRVSPVWTTWTMGVGVAVGVGVGVAVGVGVPVAVGVAVWVGAGVGVAVGVGVPVAVGVALGLGVEVGVGVGAGVSVGAGVGLSVGNAVNVATTAACTVASISGVGRPPHALSSVPESISVIKTRFIFACTPPLPRHVLRRSNNDPSFAAIGLALSAFFRSRDHLLSARSASPDHCLATLPSVGNSSSHNSLGLPRSSTRVAASVSLASGVWPITPAPSRF
jgi:hypothetical protein